MCQSNPDLRADETARIHASTVQLVQRDSQAPSMPPHSYSRRDAWNLSKLQ